MCVTSTGTRQKDDAMPDGAHTAKPTHPCRRPSPRALRPKLAMAVSLLWQSVLASLLLVSVCWAQEQLHLVYTGRKGEMALDFTSSLPSCTVSYEPSNSRGTGAALSSTVPSTSVYIPLIGYQHQAVMTGLVPNASYAYTVQCGNLTSTRRVFWSSRAREEGQKILFFADFGLNNGELVDRASSGLWENSQLR